MEIKNVFKKITKTILLSFVFGALFLPKTHAQAFKRLAVGGEAPEISLKDINGTTISTTSFKNKNTLALVFFKFPSLRGDKALAYWQKMYESYNINIVGAAERVEVIGIYCPQTDKGISGEEITGVKKIIEDNKVSFPILMDEGLGIFSKYGIITMPSTAILNKSGIVDYILTGFPEFGAERDIRINLKKILGIPEEIIVKKEEYEPKNKADFSYKLALVVQQRGNTQKAIEHLQTAISKDPDYALAYSTLGKLYVQEGNKDKAVEAFRKALSLDPNNVSALLDYGFLCMDLQKKDDALLQFTNILGIDKTKAAEGYYGMGTIYVENKIFDSAKVKLEEALKLYSGWKEFSTDEKIHFAMTYFNIGEIHVNLNDKKGAIENYKKSFEVYKGLTEGLLKERRGRAN
ncbi:tetratricopeptide repeat protein [Candidatus Poribacteria bacterium]|nr:tetratricopeptide repeat protein [Candidatus Poribacteria bacterium]